MEVYVSIQSQPGSYRILKRKFINQKHFDRWISYIQNKGYKVIGFLNA
jgi:hypothetical protein